MKTLKLLLLIILLWITQILIDSLDASEAGLEYFHAKQYQAAQQAFERYLSDNTTNQVTPRPINTRYCK